MRLLMSALIGTFVSIALFLMMSGMISGAGDVNERRNNMLNLDFIRLNLEEIENIRRRLPPPEPEKVAQLPELSQPDLEPEEMPLQPMPEIETPYIDIGGVRVGSALEMGRFSTAMLVGKYTEDGDIVPILRVEPIYPTVAMTRKIGGWVDVEYIVMPDGSVAQARVVASSPRGMFEKAALRAINKWRFKPRVVNGQPVPRAVSQRINFNVLN
jgi:protein TonB